uniref:Uncharacterized protein n=1 Tax=Trypanosoma congolense (strain IL3000) TaxID=1068625 RepID=G0UNX1_TRYCI|nr:conserved hypothetical protein [Trypanosoma congolense IL3000]
MTVDESCTTHPGALFSITTANLSLNGPQANASLSHNNSVRRALRSLETFHDGSQSRSSYLRSYTLADVGAPPPPKKLAVVLKEPLRTLRPGWNDRREPSVAPLREKLPCIRKVSRSKFDCLYKGESVKGVCKRSHIEEYIVQHSTGYRNHGDRARMLRLQSMTGLVESLGNMQLAGVLNDWKAGIGNTERVGSARKIFDILSGYTERITVDMIHDHLLMCTPAGVALYEAHDFLLEECEGKDALNFENFLIYGEYLRDRIFAYKRFASLAAEERLLAIAERVYPQPLPVAISKLRRNLMKAATAQARGNTGGIRSPMRIYELCFLDSLKLKMRSGDTLHESYEDIFGDDMGPLSHTCNGDGCSRHLKDATTLHCKAQSGCSDLKWITVKDLYGGNTHPMEGPAEFTVLPEKHSHQNDASTGRSNRNHLPKRSKNLVTDTNKFLSCISTYRRGCKDFRALANSALEQHRPSLATGERRCWDDDLRSKLKEVYKSK